MQPNQRTAEHGMITGVHTAPGFPSGSGTLLNPPTEAGLCPLVDDLPSQVNHAMVGKDFEQQACAEDTGIQVSVRLFNDLTKRLANLFQTFRVHTHAQSKDIASVGAITSGLFIPETFHESLAGASGFRFQLTGIVRLSQHMSRLGCQCVAKPIEIGMNHIGCRQFARCTPVAQHLPFTLILHVHHSVRIHIPAHELQLRQHLRISFCQHFLVAIMLVETPGHDVDGCAPGRSASTTRLPRRSVGHIACFGVLCFTDVRQPFVVEGTDIVGLHHHVAHHLTVARISRTFAVRTVAGYRAMHIVRHATAPDAVNRVDELVVGFKESHSLHVTIHGFGCHLLRLQFAGPSLDFHFTEHIPGETGGVAFHSLSTEGVAVRSHGRFTDVTDVDALSRRTFHSVQAEPTGNLFPEIDAIVSFAQLFHLLGLEAFHHPVRRPVLSHEATIRLLSCDSLFPSGVIERRRIPARLFQAGIVMLTLINHVADDGTARYFPRRVADDDFLPPVRIFQMQLEQQTRRAIALYPILLGIVETVT